MEWYQILGIVLGILLIDNIIGGIIYASLDNCWDVFVPMLSDFEGCSKINRFGCVTCYILLFIVFPIFNIGKVIYWLFHIKKDKSE